MQTHAVTEPNEPALVLRAKLIGNRVTIEQAAAAFDVTTRAIYQAIARHKIPFVKIFDVRYLDPEDLRSAIVAQSNTAPRGRGRPKRAA